MGAIADALVNSGLKQAQALIIENGLGANGARPNLAEFQEALVRAGVDHHSASILASTILSSSVSGDGISLPPDVSIPYATYGDSRANSGHNGNASAFDLRSWVTAAPTGSTAGGIYYYRSGAGLQTLYPAARLVANCGVSGDTLAGMITRESAGASATRKSLDDAWNTGARVLIFRAAVNSVTTLSTSTYDPSLTASLIASRQNLIRRAVARGFLVIDEGEAGFDYVGDSVTWPQARIDNVRRMLREINAAADAAAAASGGQIRRIDTFGLLCTPDGNWAPGMCEDLTTPGQRVHPSVGAAFIISQAEADLMASIFGRCLPSYRRYSSGLNGAGNLVPNADLTASSAGVGTGWSHDKAGTSAAVSMSIVESGGKLWQAGLFTFGGANAGNFGRLLLPIPIQSGGTITVAPGEVYGWECDYIIDDGAGGPPPTADGTPFAATVRIYGAAGNTFYTGISTAAGSPAPSAGALRGRAIWAPITISEASSAITSATQWQLTYSSAAGLPFRLMASSPRMVRLA